jgi:hypothetical protein
VDCQSVQVVTPRQFGVGTRRRCIPAHGREKIEEVSAWFEGIGYEYYLLDEARYRTWVGRLRLQAIPEGTIVQWTITYEMRGLLGRLLNWVGGRAQLEEDCHESLRRLRYWAESSNTTNTLSDSAKRRQTLQPVPSIVRSSTQPMVVPPQEAAADTKPRRPSGLDEAITEQQESRPTLPTVPPSDTLAAPVSAPPIAQPIAPPTTPNLMPAVEAQEDSPAPEAAKTEPKAPSATPTPNAAFQAPAAPNQPTPIQEQAPILPPGMPEILKVTPPQGTPKVNIARLRFADEVNTELDLTPPPDRDSGETGQTQAIRPGLPPPTSSQDTGEISIWDAFGLPAPSKMDAQALAEVVKTTGEFSPVVIDGPERESDTVAFSPLYRMQRLKIRAAYPKESVPGLTIRQRRRRVKVRQWWLLFLFG